MTATYDCIATTTLNTTASSVSFSSISGSYTDLVLVVSASVDSGEDLRFRVNDDTGSNYSYTVLHGNGTSAGSNRGANQTSGNLTWQAGVTTTLGNTLQVAHFLNYSNTTTNKTVLSRAVGAGAGVDASVNLWRSTAAITKITLAKASGFTGTFQSGSTFTLYGIKAE